MALIYRVMEQDGEHPMVGDTSYRLGVRAGTDLPVDEHGNIRPGTGGMSVAPDLRSLPYFLIPKRLKLVVPGARGSNVRRCWKMGEGPFERGAIADGLELRPDDPAHGVVEPSGLTSLAAFQAALAATRANWIDGEPQIGKEP